MVQKIIVTPAQKSKTNQKILFQSRTKEELSNFLKSNKQRKKINFLNLHDLYHYSKNESSKKSILDDKSLNFIDGFTISVYLSLTNLKKIPRIRGPTFTRDFLSNRKLSENKTHFFIGPKKKDIKKLKSKMPHLKKIISYNPPYIKETNFPKTEIKKIINLINKSKANYVWVGIGCPKQNILSQEIFPKTKAQYLINIGAALDFLLDKKIEAPPIVYELGIEWLYRLITDFNYSRKKVWRSILGLKNLKHTRIF